MSVQYGGGDGLVACWIIFCRVFLYAVGKCRVVGRDRFSCVCCASSLPSSVFLFFFFQIIVLFLRVIS